MNQRISKIKKHINDNLDLYVASTVSAVVAVTLMAKFGKPPIKVVDAQSVINTWASGVMAGGKHLYILSPTQQQMWHDCLEAAQQAARETTIRNPDYLRGLAEGSRRAMEMGA